MCFLIFSTFQVFTLFFMEGEEYEEDSFVLFFILVKGVLVEIIQAFLISCLWCLNNGVWVGGLEIERKNYSS